MVGGYPLSWDRVCPIWQWNVLSSILKMSPIFSSFSGSEHPYFEIRMWNYIVIKIVAESNLLNLNFQWGELLLVLSLSFVI